MGGLQAKIGITISPGVWMLGKRGRRGGAGDSAVRNNGRLWKYSVYFESIYLNDVI